MSAFVFESCQDKLRSVNEPLDTVLQTSLVLTIELIARFIDTAVPTDVCESVNVSHELSLLRLHCQHPLYLGV